MGTVQSGLDEDATYLESEHVDQPAPGYPRISPYLNYQNTGAMIDWLASAFGLVERHRQRGSDGRVMHAEMAFEDGVVMLGSPGGGFRNPRRLGQVTQSLYVYIDDLDTHCARARETGAEIIEEPEDHPYGDRRYGARDPEGHHWYFASRLDAPKESDRYRCCPPPPERWVENVTPVRSAAGLRQASRAEGILSRCGSP